MIANIISNDYTYLQHNQNVSMFLMCTRNQRLNTEFPGLKAVAASSCTIRVSKCHHSQSPTMTLAAPPCHQLHCHLSVKERHKVVHYITRDKVMQAE